MVPATVVARVDIGTVIVPLGIIIIIIVIVRVGVALGIIVVIAVGIVTHIARIGRTRGQGENQNKREPMPAAQGLEPPACTSPCPGPVGERRMPLADNRLSHVFWPPPGKIENATLKLRLEGGFARGGNFSRRQGRKKRIIPNKPWGPQWGPGIFYFGAD